MAIVDKKTPRLALPLPNVDNYLEDDVARLSDALTILDQKVATVGDDGKVTLEQLPAVAITDTFPVNSADEMLALNAQKGDVAIVTSDSGRQSYILMAEPASTLSNWKLLNDNQQNEKNLREQWRRSLAEAGLTLVDGSFEEGATVSTSADAIWCMAEGQCYTWGGDLPKIVPAGSTPGSTGGVKLGAWVSVGDASLRTDLSSSDGAGLIGVSSGGTVQGSLSDIENSIKHAQPLSDRRIVAIAHRGYSETYLEQTLMAYSQCNADVLEVDMQTTSDGYAVCFHDSDLSPATVGGSGAVKDNTYSTVSALRFTRAVGTRYADMAGIPTLGSVCRIAMRRGKMLHAEIKGYRTLEDCALYSSIVNQYGLSPYTTFSCFDFAPLAYTHNINPRITYALQLNSYDAWMDANIAELASWGGSVLSINKDILSTIGNKKLREWEAMGLTLAAWTVYTAEQMQTVANYGIRLIYLEKDFYNIIG